MMNSSSSSTSSADAVVCEFVRQRCTHEALFQPFYKRSNRTKGSKILRCFPHCCPNHAHRGFCGSSLHVRVQWGSAQPAGVRPPAIHVFGRFRLTDTAPLAIGHRLVASSVFSSVQSDDTPNGEWIASQIIYSWSETNWLFEINNAARWFYGWESSTVKSQRLKDHVLDVYVMAVAPVTPQFGHSSAQEFLQVVASTTSPSFQLISFRRATDDAMLALSATHHMRQQLQGATAPQAEEDEEKAPAIHSQLYSSAPLPTSAVQRLVPSGPSMVVPPGSMQLPSLRPPFGGPAPLAQTREAQWSAPPLTSRPHSGGGAAVTHSQPPATAPTASPQVAWRRDRQATQFQRPQASSTQPTSGKTVWEITNLLGQLHQIPLADAFERLAWMQETYEYYVESYRNGLSSDKKASHLLQAPSSSSASTVDVERALRHAIGSVEGASTSSTSPRRKLPSRLLATLTELALWLLFDPQTAIQIRGAVNGAQASILDPHMIRRHFGRMMFWLHDHVNRFLHVRFNRTIRDILLECQELGFQIQFEPPGSTATPTSPPLKTPPLPKTKGMDVFVAQVRQLHVSSRVTGTKRRRPGSSTDQFQRPLPPPPAAHTAMRRLFNAQWRCATDRLAIRRARPTSPTHPLSPSSSVSSGSSFSVLSLVWFWRQFSVLTLQFHEDEPRLEATSLFSCLPLHSQFLLDGKDRFFHAFPAGESTLATCVGKYTFGDYVGQYAPAVGEVQLFLYSFLSPTQLPSAEREALGLDHVASDACFCYHVRLIVTPAASLVANVTVKRGALDVPALRRVGYASALQLLSEMATWSLQQKLSAVRGFEDLHHVDLVYAQQC